MVAKPTRADAYDLFHEGALALADVERNGIRVDVPYLKGALENTDVRVARLTKKLESSEVWKKWQRRFRSKAKLSSDPQLGAILFEEMGFEHHGKNKKGYKVSEDILTEIDHPFVQYYLKRKKLQKAKSTYLKNIERELVGEYVHSFFNLHTVRTFRSSADRINLQNQPTRDPRMAKIVRSCFIARDGHQLLEIDYGALEVRGIACYCKDPVLIDYINDESRDMHRDMAMECYMLPASDMMPEGEIDKQEKARIKMIRYCAKNMFVFPEFYGSYYMDCSRNMWEAIEEHKLTTSDGRSLREHLKEEGITKLGNQNSDGRTVPGTFEHHIKQLEERFRNKRFKVHTAWREAWWRQYKHQGYLDTLTGFRLSEVYRRNQVVNSPVQGSCFHCLLWSLIQLNKWLKKHKMRTRIVCQIHDSMMLDVHPKELDDVLEKAVYLSTIAIRKHWPWIIVPLIIEAELCPIGGSWYDKKGIEL